MTQEDKISSPQSNNGYESLFQEGLDKFVDRVRSAVSDMEQVVSYLQKGMDFVKEAGDGPADLLRLSRRCRDASDAFEAAMKRYNFLVSILDEVRIPEAFTRTKTTTLTTEEGDRGTCNVKIYASIPAEKRPEAYAWLRGREDGGEALISETVNASSLSSYAKDLIENNEDLPEDLFRVHQKEKLSLTRSRKVKSPYADLVAKFK